MQISNSSKKRCYAKFDYKGVRKVVEFCSRLLEDFGTEPVISEYIYDHDDALTYNVFLFLIRENCKDGKTLKEIEKFTYITNQNKLKASENFHDIHYKTFKERRRERRKMKC